MLRFLKGLKGLGVVLFLSACISVTPLVGGKRYKDREGFFSFSLPSEGWRLVHWKGVKVALFRPQGGMGIALCLPGEEGPEASPPGHPSPLHI